MVDFMRNSRVPEKWVREMCAANPIQPVFVKDDTTGGMKHNGNYLTGPVRLSWPNLFKRGKNLNKPTEDGKFGATALFPPSNCLNFQPLQDALGRLMGEKFATFYNAQMQQYYGVQIPFRDQGEKLKFDGYTPGSVFMTCTSNFQCQVVDVNNNPIVDERRVYPGVWAILAVNPYHYGIQPPQPKKGIAFGLQSVMIVGDDVSFMGAGSDPRQDFAKVSITAATPVSSMFGATPPQGPGAGAASPMGILGAGGGPAMPIGAPPAGYPGQGAPALAYPGTPQYTAEEMAELKAAGIL